MFTAYEPDEKMPFCTAEDFRWFIGVTRAFPLALLFVVGLLYIDAASIPGWLPEPLTLNPPAVTEPGTVQSWLCVARDAHHSKCHKIPN